METELIKLNNGLSTLFIDSPGCTAASVQIWFRAGSALESEKNQGIAHFLEHMFFKGTPTRPGAKIADEVETFGGEINAFTSFDYTCYYINAPQDQLIPTVDILLDMVSNPQFKQDDLVPEREVVFEEYKRSLDNPGQFAFKKLQESCFTGSYAHQILGQEKTIKNFSREQLIEFRNSFYNLSNSLLVVAGDLNKIDKIKSAIEKYHLPKGPSSKFPPFTLKHISTEELHQKEVRQVVLNICIQAPSYKNISAVKEDLAMCCLGHGESSRLYQELVIKATLTSSVSSSTMFFNDGGIHFIRASFPIENQKKIFEQLEAILASILQKGLDDEDVKKIQNQYSSSKIYEKESIESFAFSLGHSFAQTGDIFFEDKYIDGIKRCSVEEVNHSLKEIFSRSIHCSIQYPTGVDTKKEKIALKNFQQKLLKLQKLKLAMAKAKKGHIKSKYDSSTTLVHLAPHIDLIHRKNSMTPTFVFHAYHQGGISRESTKNNGHHHILANCLKKGHDGISYKELKKELDHMSANISSVGGKNAFGLTMHGLSENYERLTEHFFGCLQRPSLEIKFINHEKKLAKRALENFKEDPVKVCFQTFNQIVFNGHPYSLSQIGDNKSLTLANRKNLLSLLGTSYRTGKTVLTYCGDQSLDSVIKSLDLHMKGFKKKGIIKPWKNQVKPLTGVSKHISFDREQTHIVIGLPAYNLKDKNDLFLKMLTAHLSGQSSELFVKVRDELGLCYSVQPIHLNALEAGYWGIYIGTGNDKVKGAINAIFDVLNNIRDKGFSSNEFNRIKSMLKGQSLVHIQTNEDYANLYSIAQLHGLGLDFHHQSLDKIQNIKREDFNHFLKKFLSQDWNKVIVGQDT